MSISYRDSGVDIDAGDRAVELIKAKVRSTFGPQVLTGLRQLRLPLRLQRLPGAGAGRQRRRRGHQAEDRLRAWTSTTRSASTWCTTASTTSSHPARPLFFLDYVAMDKLLPERVAEIIGGLAEGCRDTGCALVGVRRPRCRASTRTANTMWPGSSSGRWREPAGGREPHPGGRPDMGAAFQRPSHQRLLPGAQDARGEPLKRHWPELGRTLGEELLEPHRCYLEPIGRLMEMSGARVRNPKLARRTPHPALRTPPWT